MTYNKALKVLERKGNGFITLIDIMESPVSSADDFVEYYFNTSWAVGNAMFKGNKMLQYFSIYAMEKPMQTACFNLSHDTIDIYADDKKGNWQWYSFTQLYNKLGNIKLNFGLDEDNRLIRSSTENNISLYG